MFSFRALVLRPHVSTFIPRKLGTWRSVSGTFLLQLGTPLPFRPQPRVPYLPRRMSANPLGNVVLVFGTCAVTCFVFTFKRVFLGMGPSCEATKRPSTIKHVFLLAHQRVQRPTDAQERSREGQRGAEMPREAQRCQEIPRGPERPREA